MYYWFDRVVWSVLGLTAFGALFIPYETWCPSVALLNFRQLKSPDGLQPLELGAWVLKGFMDYQPFFQLPLLENHLLVLSYLEQDILNRSMKIEYASRTDNPPAYVKTKLPLLFGDIVLN